MLYPLEQSICQRDFFHDERRLYIDAT